MDAAEAAAWWLAVRLEHEQFWRPLLAGLTALLPDDRRLSRDRHGPRDQSASRDGDRVREL
jgi:hypothetical protein